MISLTVQLCHLLMLNSVPLLTPGASQELDMYKARWKCVQHLADQFWKRWLQEYLPELTRRRKWQDAKRSLAVGDVVIVKDESTPRAVCPLGLVLETRSSQDGLVRSAKIRVNGKEFIRPVVKLVNLECA